jgi:LacI family transcriptional regulator
MSTIVDVARAAGVSTATVSRVINNPSAVRRETRDRVRRAMEDCRYRYNALARGFATKRTATIGLIVPTVTNPGFAESTRGVQDAAAGAGRSVLLGNTDYDPATEAELIRVFRELQVEGMVITTTAPGAPVLRALADEGFPFVLLYSTLRRGPISCVGVDNYLGGQMATEHLVANGHRRIAMIAGAFRFSDKSHHRWNGYRRCLRRHGIAYDSRYLVQTTYRLESGREAVQRVLAARPRPTAVFCSNDYLAIGVMEGARASGLRLPEDLSIVGFDDIPLAAYVSPGLDTVRQPAYRMGRLGAEALIERMEGAASSPVHRLLAMKLVVRGSVSPPGAARPASSTASGADSGAHHQTTITGRKER